MQINIRRFRAYILWFLIVPLVAVSASAAPSKTRVLYFSSFAEIMQPDGKPGLAELATAIHMETAKNPNIFFVHGGASLGPSVFGAMDNGAHMVDILNALNPSVMAIGKREFSYGYDNFILNALSASFPLVTSNLTDALSNGPIDATYPTYVLQASDLSIGVIALTSANAIAEYGSTQAKFSDPVIAAIDAAALLRLEGADAIILLADTDFDDLSALRANGAADVIFYTHNFDNPQSLDRQGSLLTEGAMDGMIIAVDFWLEDGADGLPNLLTSAELLPLSTFEPDPFVAEIIGDYQRRLDQLLGPGIATVTKPFDTLRSNIRSRENAFANLIVDALRDQVSADIAMLNGGTIRGNVEYPVGHKISRGDIQRELPFGGRSAVVRMNGADIWKTLEHGIDCGLRVDGCFTHVGNLQVTWDSRKLKGDRIISILVAGDPIEPDIYYRVATSDFMARGNDGYKHLGTAEKLFDAGTNQVIWNVVVEYIVRSGQVAPVLEGRMHLKMQHPKTARIMSSPAPKTRKTYFGLGFKIKVVVVALVALMATVAGLSFYTLQQFSDQVTDYSNQTLPALAASIDLKTSLEKIVQNTEQLVNSDVQAKRRIAHTATQDSVAGINNLLASRETLIELEEIRTVLAILSETTNDLNMLIENKINITNHLSGLNRELGVSELSLKQQNALPDQSAAYANWLILERKLISQVANLSTSNDARSQQRQIPAIVRSLRTLSEKANDLPSQAKAVATKQISNLEAKLNGDEGVILTLRDLTRADARANALERQMRVLVSELLRKTDNLATQKNDEAQATAQNLVRQSQQQLVALVISVAVALAIAVAGFFFIEKRVVARLLSLRDVVIGRAAGGQHSVQVDGRDEVTEIGNAVQVFIDEIDARQKQIVRGAEQTNAIIRLSPQAMCIAAGSEILYHNEAFELMWPGIGSPDGHTSILALFPSMLLSDSGPTGVRSVARHAITDKYNNVRWFNMTSNNVEWHGTKARQLIAVDTTKQVQVEHTLEEARSKAEAAAQTKSSFLAMMSHEIRSPMNGIISIGEMLEKSDLDTEQNQLVTIINQSAETLLTILDDVLDLSKIEAGKLQINNHHFDLRSILEGIANLLKQGFQQKNVSFEVDLSDDLPQFVIGDSNRIRQIMYNLLSNALKFTENGAVQLIASTEKMSGDHGCTVRIAVKDTGIGINPKIMNRLFQPFEQADSSVARQYGGTGLGLTICRRLASLMGGEITVNSTEGRGSTFALMVPLEITGDAVLEPAQSTGTPSARLADKDAHILVVEDNKVNQMVIGKILKSLGYKWDTADDGVSALEIFNPDLHTIILTDLRMPRMDGFALASNIRAMDGHGADVPIIALSADAMEETKVKSEKSGINVFLTKPVKIGEVQKCLQSFN